MSPKIHAPRMARPDSMNSNFVQSVPTRLMGIGFAIGLAATACNSEGPKASGTGGRPGTGGAAGTANSGGATGTGGGSSSGGATSSGGVIGAAGGSGNGGVTGGGGGLTGSGGDQGTGGAGGMVMLLPCGIATAVNSVYNASLASNMPLITDFTYTAGPGVSIFFGDTYNQVTGLTYHFPERAIGAAGAGGGGGGSAGAGGRGGAGGAGGRGGAAGAAAGPPGLTEDLTASNWHITGTVAPGLPAYAFVMRFTCTIDASAYSGIEFTIGGNAGPANSLSLQAGFGDDLPPGPDSLGTGICPANGCMSPSTIITVPPTVTTVQIPWSRFTGGRPMNTVNPAQLAQFLWPFTIRAAAYNVDFVIDDLRFYTAPADAGAGN
jgi:hypothetical protein